MIWTVFEINLRRLLHNRVELMLTFVVPIAFFSIFAIIFGGGVGSAATPRIKVVAVDEVDSPSSRSVVSLLKENEGLRFMRDDDPSTITPDQAAQLVRHGSVTVAIVLRQSNDVISADLFTDASDQVAGQVATALVSRSLMLVDAKQRSRAIKDFAAQAGAPSADDVPSKKAAIIHQQSTKPAASDPIDGGQQGPAVRIVDVMGEGKANPVVSMYAAGIAVMFLLFGATGGGGALLEERENKTLDRLLSTCLSMDQLLLGKWFYMTAIGVLQVSVMFVWGQIIFGIDLVGHLDGFLMMTVVTASAASAFGLLLATLCRTRGQLNGLSVVLVLTMSALGGSMVPRYVMSERLQQYGLWTFNAWALDGYDKVFWRELPVQDLSPQLTVLLVCGIVFLLAARMLAVRWETD